jgi:hypothetical protein
MSSNSGSKYLADDGMVVLDTDLATHQWSGLRRWDGSHKVDVNTGLQYSQQFLYRSSKGRYYTVTFNQDRRPVVEWKTEHQAAVWLIMNEHPLPGILQRFEDIIVE